MMSENDSIVPKEAAMAELRAGQLVLRYNRVIERVLDLHHADLPVANVGTFKHCERALPHLTQASLCSIRTTRCCFVVLVNRWRTAGSTRSLRPGSASLRALEGFACPQTWLPFKRS